MSPHFTAKTTWTDSNISWHSEHNACKHFITLAVAMVVSVAIAVSFGISDSWKVFVQKFVDKLFQSLIFDVSVSSCMGLNDNVIVNTKSPMHAYCIAILSDICHLKLFHIKWTCKCENYQRTVLIVAQTFEKGICLLFTCWRNCSPLSFNLFRCNM